MSCHTTMRQTCTHPQVVRRAGVLQGASGLSMARVMKGMSEIIYKDYDRVRCAA